jgi:hypothetical protein
VRRPSLSALVVVAMLAASAAASPATAAPAPVITPIDAEHPLEFEDHRPRAEASVAVDPRDPRRVVITAMQFNQAMAGGLYSGYDAVVEAWVSRTGGTSYHGVGPLPLPRPKAQRSEHATLAWDPHGPLYAAYSVIPDYGQTEAGAGLWVARSFDGGRSWQRVGLVEPSHCGGPTRPVIAVDPVRGWVYVAYTVEVEPDCDGPRDYTQSSLRWARSTDGGLHFGKPVIVTDQGAGSYPAPTVLRDGTVLISHLAIGGVSLGDEVCPSVDQEVLVARYTPDGRRLDTSTAIPRLCLVGAGLSANGAAFTPVTYPAITSDPSTGAVVVAASYQGQVERGVMTAASSDGGRTWTQGLVKGGPGSEATLPALSAAAGRVGLSWLEVAPGGTYRPMLTSSSDGGRMWEPAVQLASEASVGNTHPQNGYDTYGFGQYQGLVVGPDRVAHTAWPDLRPRGERSQDVDVWTRNLRL